MRKKDLEALDNVHPLVMTEEYWANSQFSVVRYYGQMKFNGHVYMIVDKLGRDIFQCSIIAKKEGREKAIEAGEPCDLVIRELIPVYRKLGRDEFLKRIKEGAKPSELLNEIKARKDENSRNKEQGLQLHL